PTPVGFEQRGGEPLPRELERALPAAATGGIEALARRHRLTPGTLVAGAWGLLLGHVSGEREVVFGVTVSGRSAALEGFESMVGLFVNTLPVRLRLPPSQALLPWLEDLQQQQLALQRFEHSPLASVQKWSGVPAGQELFDSAMVFENYPIDAVVYEAAESLGVVEVCSIERTHYALHLIAVPGHELRLRIGYDGRRFDRSSMERMMGHLVRLLTALAPDRRIGELPWLDPEETQQLLLEWNDTAGWYPREASIPELFAAQVRARPEAVAVLDEDGLSWSYGRLDAASSRLARHLRSVGVDRGSAVGISMERSADLVVGLLGILKAEGAYVPLDPRYPDERLGFMLADLAGATAAGTPVVLVHGRTRERLAGLAGCLVCLDQDREEIGGRSSPPPDRTAGTDLAYVIYTSGSTGRPKGVAVPHRAVVRLVQGTDYAQLGPRDRVAHVSNISFDAATFEVWGALLNGGALVVIAQEVLLEPAAFAERLRQTGVTAMFLTAALFNQVVREEPAAFHSLRHLLVGGEALDPATVAQALASGAPERLLNGYGPTESTTFAVWHEVREVAPDALSLPIGRPLANTTAYVLDPWQGLAAVGEVGELLIGGDGLAWGYWNRPELTAERFVPHPWSAAAGARLYRTGDLARRRWNGGIDCLGRIDQQVKLRGFRIELGEIEAALAGHPSVRKAVVVSREDRPGEKRLVAYLVRAELPPAVALPALGELRAFLRQRLPDFMVPAAFVTLDELPLSPNGKVDRRALPAPENLRPDLEQDFVEPRSALERELAAIWTSVLKLQRVGRDDNFFELGGDSILTIQVVARAEQAGLRLTPKQLFEHPTVGELATVTELVVGSGEEPR
ncbi:MAG: amino acid adenylation domain-containing protein, partial [Acidobacteriota bacterium]|nr:amino acid adenylation domain-containing protein [Acidobacteriota bacterium]